MSIIIDLFFFSPTGFARRASHIAVASHGNARFFPKNFHPSPPPHRGRPDTFPLIRVHVFKFLLARFALCARVLLCYIIIIYYFFFSPFRRNRFPIRAPEETPCKQRPTAMLLLLLLFSIKRRHPNVCEKKNVVGAHFLGTKTVFFPYPVHRRPFTPKSIKIYPPKTNLRFRVDSQRLFFLFC